MIDLKTPKMRQLPAGGTLTKESLPGQLKDDPPGVPGETLALVDASLARTGKYFAVRAVGDGMKLAGVNDGDVVIVRWQPAAEDGDIVVVEWENAALIRRLECSSNHTRLLAANPNYDPIEIDPLEDESFRIFGKVVSAHRSLTEGMDGLGPTSRF